MENNKTWENFNRVASYVWVVISPAGNINTIWDSEDKAKSHIATIGTEVMDLYTIQRHFLL